MAQQKINYSQPNDNLGDSLRSMAKKSDDNFDELYQNKVDKVIGKDLSDVNFSQIDKAKLDSLSANQNPQSDWSENNAAEPDFIKNKPTKLSQFDNDSQFIGDVSPVGIYGRRNGVWELIDEKIKLNFLTFNDFPQPGVFGKVYLAEDTNKLYRWTGTSYIEVSGDSLQAYVDAGLASKEDLINKSQDIETDKLSFSKYPSVKAVYDWVVLNLQALGNNLTKALVFKENKSEKNQPLGYAGLDADLKIDKSQIPNLNFVEIYSNNDLQFNINDRPDNVFLIRNTQTLTLPVLPANYNFEGITDLGVTVNFAIENGLTTPFGAIIPITEKKIFTVLKRETNIYILGV